MTTKKARVAAAVKANNGELSLIEALQTGVFGIWIKNHKKLFSAIVSIAGSVLSLNLLHGTAETVVTSVIAILGALGVQQLDNTVTEDDV